jgi:hypothetical protein
MRLSFRLCTAVIALIVMLAGATLSSAARADEGYIAFRVIKGGWIIGASAGSGVLTFQGHRYPVSIGGLSAGLVFGASATNFRGTVRHIRSPYDVSGVYGAVGAGAALGAGGQAIVLRNEKGAVLRLLGHQVGLQVNIDLSGMSISVK